MGQRKLRQGKLHRARRGAAAVSYGLLVGLVALAILVAIASTGQSLSALFGQTANRMGEVAPAEIPAAPPEGPPADDDWALSVTPGSAHLTVAGTALPAQSEPALFTVTNLGPGATAAVAATLTNAPHFVLDWDNTTCGASLAVGDSCVWAIRAQASENVASDSTQVLFDGGKATATLTMEASGFAPLLAVPDAQTALTVAAIADGAATGACTPLPVRNDGTAPLQALTMALPFTGADPAHFSACTDVDSTCVDSLAPQESCNFGIQLLGGEPGGTYNAVATVSATGQPAIPRALTGTASGYAPALELVDGGAALAVAAITDGASTGACTALPVRNGGTATMNGIAIDGFAGDSPSAFTGCAAADTPCGASLAPGATCNLGVALQASAPGTFSATVAVAASGVAAQSRGLTGSAGGYAPALELVDGSSALTVAAITDGSGSGACTALPVRNSGTAAMTGIAIDGFGGEAPAAFAGCAAAASPCGASLAPGAGCNLGIALQASAPGTFSATVSVVADAVAAQSRALTGAASGYAPALELVDGGSALTVAAITDGSSSGACTALAVRNSGSAAMTGIAIDSFGGDAPAAFAGCAAAASPCSGSLAPGASCNLGVALQASGAGTFTATVAVVADGIGAHSRSLTGSASGYAPVLELVDGGSALAVAAIADGSSSGACTALPVRNSGTARLDNLALEGFTGADAAHFQGCAAAASPCGSSLAAGASCNFGIRVVASAAGSFSASATVTGTGVAPAARALTGSASGYAPVMQVAGSLAVAAITDGSAVGGCTALAVSNTGTAPLSGLALGSFGGSDAAHFASCTPGSAACSASALAPGASCNFGIHLLASGAGSYSGNVTVAGTGVATATVTLSGSASGYAPQLALVNGGSALAVTAIADGSASGACTALPVANSGTAPMSGVHIDSFGGTDAAHFEGCTFGSNACGSSVAAGASCNLGVRVIATAGGSFQGTVAVAATGLQTQSRALTGSAGGYAPVLRLAGGGSVTAAAISGNSTTTGACTDVLVENTGTAGLSNLAFGGFSGGNASNFQGCAASTAQCQTGLAAGASCRYGVRLSANWNGSYSTTLTVSGTETSATATVSGSASGFVRASCAAIKAAGEAGSSGTYNVDPDGPGGNAAFTVYCDMDTDGGGWMLVAKVDTTASDLANPKAEPSTWFVNGQNTGQLNTPADQREGGLAAFPVAQYLPVVSTSTVARVIVIAESDTSQNARWFKGVTPGNIQTWFRANEPTPTPVCDTPNMSCGTSSAFTKGGTGSSGGATVLTGMSLASRGVPQAFCDIHMRQDDDESPQFSGVCSCTSDSPLWHDQGGDGHWGNGLQIWIR